MIKKIIPFLTLAFLFACSDFDAEWKREPYNGTHFSKLVVMGLSHDLDARKFYETETINQIKQKGFIAQEGLSIFPQEITELDNNHDSITSLIIKNNVDGVLVIKILSEKDKEYFKYEDYNKFKNLYFTRKSYHTFTPGYYKKPEKYYMIATLYDLKEKHEENEETVIWTASKKIYMPSENVKAKKEFISNTVDHIINRHLIK